MSKTDNAGTPVNPNDLSEQAITGVPEVDTNDDNSFEMDFGTKIAKMPKFEPIKQYHDLCVGYITSVEVVSRMVEPVNKDGQPSQSIYVGHSKPTLVFRFSNHKLPGIDTVEREYIKSYDVLGFKAEIDGGKPAENYKFMFKTMYEQLTYMVQFFQSINRNLAVPQFPKKLTLDCDVETRIAEFNAFFTAIANWFNTAQGGKPVFKDATGKNPIILAIKLIATTKKSGNGRDYKALDIPSYVAEGFFDKFVNLITTPAIKLKGNESVVLTSVKAKVGQPGVDISIPGSEMVDNIPPEIAALYNQQS